MPLADWLSEHPPMFYASDKSTFEGVNLMLAPQLQAVSLTKGDTQVIDWDECEIRVEFVIDNNTEKARNSVQSYREKGLYRNISNSTCLASLT